MKSELARLGIPMSTGLSYSIRIHGFPARFVSRNDLERGGCLDQENPLC